MLLVRNNLRKSTTSTKRLCLLLHSPFTPNSRMLWAHPLFSRPPQQSTMRWEGCAHLNFQSAWGEYKSTSISLLLRPIPTFGLHEHIISTHIPRHKQLYKCANFPSSNVLDARTRCPISAKEVPCAGFSPASNNACPDLILTPPIISRGRMCADCRTSTEVFQDVFLGILNIKNNMEDDTKEF